MLIAHYKNTILFLELLNDYFYIQRFLFLHSQQTILQATQVLAAALYKCTEHVAM